ncbi:MAG: diguanylate cyclase [Natronospirillum sp.]|uniref:diguanylate cyclase n=1 Tax=Natronospirillum sp. TaxID=2812955 RepID=UPI0025F99B47|nr:diguanylate cyclase [Natronospirillum sp.]MCH8551357.1 diguanylate cyclase [Natronospirillum sp.]
MDKSKVRELQSHFGRRVVGDARSVVDQWYQLQRQGWHRAWYELLVSRAERLEKSARRYNREALGDAAAQLLQDLTACRAERPPQSSLLSQLADQISAIGQQALRHSDREWPGASAFMQQEVYIAIEDETLAADLQHQLESFGIASELTLTLEALQEARARRRPAAILMDCHFRGEREGFALAEEIQQEGSVPLPVIFYQQEPPDMDTRLQAMRLGGKAFLDAEGGLLRVVERLERETRTVIPELYRVLIVDDSKTQAQHSAQVLNGVGIIAEVLNEPMALLQTIDDFQPDLILMDMYMPRCTGVELATVMRQQPQYDRLPIVFLSAEEDMAKQMAALAEGGDDFLTKPVHPSVLTATVQHRCKRNRAMRFWMERDALTGLFDHTHLFQRLQQEVVRAERQDQPLTFIMIDLDRFKSVNDTWGHGAGDRILKNLSLLLRQRLRKTDIIGRYGGEEFAIIMPDTTVEAASQVIQELLDAFSDVRHAVENDDIRQFITCTFSAGLAQLQTEESLTDLSGRADQALYQAKADGRARLSLAPDGDQ